MAYDKVVDSAALDAAMTDIADSIRAKTGKTEPLTLAQMPSEIEGISGGSVYENLKYAKKVSFANTTLPDTFEVTLPNGQTDFSYLFERVYVKNIIVHSSITPTSMVETFKYANLGGLCTITLDFDTSKVTTYNNCFAFGIGDWGAHFTAIYGVLDFTSVTTAGAGMFSATNKLTYATFAANTLGVNFNASVHVFFLGNRLVRTTVFLSDTLSLSYLNKFFGDSELINEPDITVVEAAEQMGSRTYMYATQRRWQADMVRMESRKMYLRKGKSVEKKECLDIYLNDFNDMINIFSR